SCGKTASDGFEALAHYDSNEDGMIDANDPIWSELGVWQFSDSAYVGAPPDGTDTPPDGGG
ncbi:hypothetical protein ACFL2Q_10725, partial [Thermodesulfobacteriota bacterium]